MTSLLLFIKRVFHRFGIDISFVRKEETRSAIELNDVDTVNIAWSDQKISNSFLSKTVLERFQETLSILKDHDIELSGKSVIDVGCGNGMLLKFLADNFAVSSQTGMEYAEAAVEVAKKVNPAATYIVHDINTPYPERYEAVVSTEVLEHILHPVKAFGNLLALVQVGGVLFITVPNGRIDTFAGHINFWSPESWDVFIAENSNGLKYATGEAAKGLLYAIVHKVK
jgi:2-polyprenyl-3-methyl-5-hydroxy-6-metoxy-1,4-benzoquinol methylase